jgi:ATP-dependent 26S proteasome regulatory subunit
VLRPPQQSDTQDIRMNTRMIDNEVKMMRQERVRLQHEREQMVEKIADNTTKIKQNKVLPYLVSKVVEVGWDGSSIHTRLIPDSLISDPLVCGGIAAGQSSG